ncbi:MAG TPA: hypothetical protein VFB80_11500 [Pirellulaceae bacterium]|nr:hypothetical protein [Pirellulaceae bacterium]
MSRPSSGGFVLGFAAEIAIVVAVVSLLPKLDLSGGRAVPAADLPPSLVSQPQETSYYERRTENAPPLREPAVARRDLPVLREPPPLIAADPSRPAFVERRLDQASQKLVNGLGSYVARSADNLNLPPPPNYSPLPPAAAPNQPTTAPDFATASFPTQPVPKSPPRPWMKY